MINIENLLTVEDVQNILRISRNTAYKLFKTDGFPSIKIGKAYRVDRDEFKNWIKKYTGKEFILA